MVAAALFATLAPVAAQEGRKVALVFGNGAYRHDAALQNPGNDARALGETLRALGFEVMLGIDLDRRAMERRVREFGDRLEGARVGLFYYSGHGLQVSGENWLLPVDARLGRERDLGFEAVSLSQILKVMEGGATPRTNLIFLDACRTNPFASTMAGAAGGRAASPGRGLAPVDAGIGTLVAFATQPGSVASDGRGANSPFTDALVRHLPSPGLEIRQVMTRVREAVVRETRREQVPWDHSSLLGDVVLVRARPEQAPVPGPPPQSGGALTDGALEVSFWESVRDSRRPADLEAYLERWPGGVFAALARGRLEALRSSPQQAALPVPQPGGAAPTAEPPQAIGREQVAEAQRLLARLGLDAGSADGVAGARTRKAIEVFQGASGLRANGQIDAALLERMRSAPPPRADLARELSVAALKMRRGGSVEEAVRLQMNAVRLAPGDAELVLALGELHADAGRASEARRLYEQARELGRDPEFRRRVQERLALLPRPNAPAEQAPAPAADVSNTQAALGPAIGGIRVGIKGSSLPASMGPHTGQTPGGIRARYYLKEERGVQYSYHLNEDGNVYMASIVAMPSSDAGEAERRRAAVIETMHAVVPRLRHEAPNALLSTGGSASWTGLDRGFRYALTVFHNANDGPSNGYVSMRN